MKKHVFGPLAVILILICTLSPAPATAQSAEFERSKTEIRNTIEKETMAYVNRDSTLLLSFYADDEVTHSAWNNPDGTYGLHQGLNSIAQTIKKAFRDHPEKMHMPDIKRIDWFFKPLSDNWMWVNFIQKMNTVDGKLYTSYETRLMKRENGVWKICVMNALSNHAKD